mgnify:CR=1 FL=1
MIKKTVIAVTVILAFVFVGCFAYVFYDSVPMGDATGVSHTDKHDSQKFTDEEINEAIDAVKKKFIDFEGCTLKELYFDEEKNNTETLSYLSNGKGSVNGATEDNVIILLSSFDVDECGGDGSFNSDSTYDDWLWILIREDKNSSWVVDDWGY